MNESKALTFCQWFRVGLCVIPAASPRLWWRLGARWDLYERAKGLRFSAFPAWTSLVMLSPFKLGLFI